jgi:pilus assembly protein Flp/PilA
MNKVFLRLFSMLRSLATSECGQDMVEYALVVALVAFAATAGVKKVATGLNTAYSNVSVTLGTNIT